jgi:hypothetical protein
MPLSESSNVAAQPALQGQNTANGDGVVGEGRRGVVGTSANFQGVYGLSQMNAGVVGEAPKFHGVYGVSHDPNNGGVYGTNDAKGFGVIGVCPNGRGVQGDSAAGEAVVGVSQTGRGVHGSSDSWQGVYGVSQTNAGVVGEGAKFHGVYGVSHDPNNGGVYGTNDSGGFGVIGVSPNGIGISGKGKLAARFEGDVEVTGDIRFTNGDCAEEFAIECGHPVEAGTVMVLCEQGALRPSVSAYDKRVAGVVSGAGDYRPAIVLDKQSDESARQPIALVGKVCCKVEAREHPVEIGDLLTTSNQPGYAMKAADPAKAFGAVIGKALKPLAEGCGLIPILVALQ